jgi:hypothetical protein
MEHNEKLVFRKLDAESGIPRPKQLQRVSFQGEALKTIQNGNRLRAIDAPNIKAGNKICTCRANAMKCASTTSSSSTMSSSLDRAQRGTCDTRDAEKMYLEYAFSEA